MSTLLYKSKQDEEREKAWLSIEEKYPFLADVTERHSIPKQMKQDQVILIIKERNNLALEFFLAWIESLSVVYKNNLEMAANEWKNQVIERAPIDVVAEIAVQLQKFVSDRKLPSIFGTVAGALIDDAQKYWTRIILESSDYVGYTIVETINPVLNTEKERKAFEKKLPNLLKKLSVDFRTDLTIDSASYKLLQKLFQSKTWMEPINKFIQEMEENKRNFHASRLDELVKYMEIFKETNQSQIHHLVQQNPRIADVFANNFPLIVKEFPKESKQRVAEIVWVYEMDTGVPVLVETFQKDKSDIVHREIDQDWSENIVNLLKTAQFEAKARNSAQDVKQIQQYLDQLQLILPRDVNLTSLPKDVVKFTVTSIHWVNLQVLPSISNLTQDLVETWAREEKLPTSQYDPRTTVILSIVPETKTGKLPATRIPFSLVEYPKRNDQYILTQPFFSGAVFPEPVFSALNKLALQGIRYVMREKGWLPDSPWIIYEKWFASMYAPLHLEKEIEEEDIISESEPEEEPTPEDLAFINDENAYTYKYCTFLIKEVGRK